MPRDEPLLQADNVHRRFGGLKAVDGMNLSVQAGELVGLIGPNGAGKTTFFNLLSGFLEPDSGTVRFNGRRIDHLGPHRRAEIGLVRTFQITRALAGMSVADNVRVAAQGHPGENAFRALVQPRRVKRYEATVAKEANDLMDTFQLADLAHAYAGSLSGGQKKLLELARALMTKPKMLMLDEPLAGVNPSLARQIMKTIHRVRKERNLTILLVEHDLEAVFNHCTRVVVMAQGKPLAEGDPKTIRSNPAVVDAYLGTRPANAQENGG